MKAGCQGWTVAKDFIHVSSARKMVVPLCVSSTKDCLAAGNKNIRRIVRCAIEKRRRAGLLPAYAGVVEYPAVAFIQLPKPGAASMLLSDIASSKRSLEGKD